MGEASFHEAFEKAEEILRHSQSLWSTHGDGYDYRCDRGGLFINQGVGMARDEREMSVNQAVAMQQVQELGEACARMIDRLHEDTTTDKRWVSIGRTQLHDGLRSLLRAIATPATFVCALLLVAGCVSPYKEATGTYIKTAHTEFRSPFGTNDSFAKLQRCKGPEYLVLFYTDGDFTECRDLPVEEAYLWQHGYSQGQGGQILEGAMNAGALGGLAATRAGGTAAASAGAVAVQSVSVTVGKGRR